MSAVDRFIACARGSIGERYCTPPQEPQCTDCSGLIKRCYREATGQDMTGDSHAQFQLGTPIKHGLILGDLLFYDTGFSQRLGNRASHVGIFIGDNRMINALNEDYGIVESSINSDYWRTRYLGARRIFTEGAPLAGEPIGKPPKGSGPEGGESGPNPGPSTKPTRDRERQKRREKDRQRRGGRKGRR